MGSFRQKLILYIENLLQRKILEITIPPQGMSSKVILIVTDKGEEYAVKYGADAKNDVPALEVILRENIQIPIPNLIAYFDFEETPVIIMEKIKHPLLESISTSSLHKYVPSMIKNLKKLHSIKSPSPGLLVEPNNSKSWKNMILSIFTKDFDWEEVSKREALNRQLVLNSVEKVINKINTLELELEEYSLLHTDFNQRNLFVNEDSEEIVGIIDWEDAMYGDPLYDFARVRMFIWHFDLGDKVIDDYYNLMNYSEDEKKLEDLYWLSRVIQYLAWYSEELNEFNLGRINLHQNYLQNYIW